MVFLHHRFDWDRKKCFRTDKLSHIKAASGLYMGTRRRTASKQSRLRYGLAKKQNLRSLHCFSFPQKAWSAFRGPRKSQDFKGRGATKRKHRYLQRKYDISVSCDEERRSLFKTQGIKTEEIRRMTNFLFKFIFLFYIMVMLY